MYRPDDDVLIFTNISHDVTSDQLGTTSNFDVSVSDLLPLYISHLIVYLLSTHSRLYSYWNLLSVLYSYWTKCTLLMLDSSHSVFYSYSTLLILDSTHYYIRYIVPQESTINLNRKMDHRVEPSMGKFIKQPKRLLQILCNQQKLPLTVEKSVKTVSIQLICQIQSLSLPIKSLQFTRSICSSPTPPPQLGENDFISGWQHSVS